MYRRLFGVFCLLLAAAVCYSQNVRVIGNIPPKGSAKLYQIQVGALRLERNARDFSGRLTAAGFQPSCEKYLDFTRVLLKGVAAKDIAPFIAEMGRLGFREVIVREDLRPEKPAAGKKPAVSVKPPEEPAAAEKPADKNLLPEILFSEKWEVTTPSSPYLFFEFSEKGGYIAAGKNEAPAGEPVVHWGEYYPLPGNTLLLKDLGELKITSRADSKIGLEFTPGDSDAALSLAAKKTGEVSGSPKTALFSKQWKLSRVDGMPTEGTYDEQLFLFSKTGTCLIRTPDGEAALVQWKWADAGETTFLYSRSSWEQTGAAYILELNDKALKFDDTKYSSAEHEILEFVPADGGGGL
jgi:hypothetical protein